MRVDNNNNATFGALKVFPYKARNSVAARLHVYCDMPAPHQVVGDTFETGIYFFHDLARQKAYIEELGKGIPFLETEHVVADIPKVQDTIVQTFVELAQKAGWQ